MIRWLCTGLLILASLPFLAMGTFVAIKFDWKPMHSLTENELYRINSARNFINLYALTHGSQPTSTEFLDWATKAPSELRLEGVGFTYTPYENSSPQSYEFSFWDGDAWLTWRSDSKESGMAEISPSNYFITNSKLTDLLLFFGPAGFLLFMARLVKPAPLSTMHPNKSSQPTPYRGG